MKHVILAGGSGTRLWPFSRSSFPKQFLHFGDKQSLLQKTIYRFYPTSSPQDFLIVTNQAYFHLTKQQLIEIDPAFQHQILVEPERKNTAPAISLAVKFFQEKLGVGSDECFLVSSADHIISPASAFIEAAQKGEPWVRKGNHLIFGIRPNKPETGYGYIKTGEIVGEHLCKVDAFVEKPDIHAAQIYLMSGRYLWNAGIFLFQIGNFLSEMKAHCPQIHAIMQGSYEQMVSQFSHMPDISIDYCLLEKSHRILVAPLDIIWSDVGSWDSIYDLFDKDINQNVKLGNVIDVDTKHCLIMGSKRLISTVGLEDLLVVDTEDALFIGKRGQSQTVKKLVEEMKKRNAKECSEHSTSRMPWGTYTKIKSGTGYRINHIVVGPGKQVNLEFHCQKEECWIVIRGIAKIIADTKETILQKSEVFCVLKSGCYGLENLGEDTLELIKVELGESIEEMDASHFEDACQTV